MKSKSRFDKELNQTIIVQTLARDRYRCVLCPNKYPLDPPHHCFFKSEYFGRDRDEPWNLVTLCHSCHHDIHSGTRTDLAQICRKLALRRYKGKNKEELLKIIKSRSTT